MTHRILRTATALALLVACGTSDGPISEAVRGAADSSTTSTTTTAFQPIITGPATSSAPPTRASAATLVTLPSGDPVPSGYPKLVPRDNVDSRVANWYRGSPSDQLVALAPGVYAAYNPAVPDLASYLGGPNSGDCAARRRYFPRSSGACWEGVA